MRIKQIPEDFRVEEQVALPPSEGAYAYYRVEKQGVATLAVQNDLAAKLKVTPSALTFPALKDRQAITIQYASVRKRGPAEIRGKGYVAQRIGWGSRALRPTDLLGNRFSIMIRDLAEEEAEQLASHIMRLQTFGLPNYFDDQRFGSLTKRGFVGKEILKRDAETVVHMYLAEPMIGDPRPVREFKRLAAGHWGEWGYLLHQAPRSSNLRSVITYLKDHPHDYRKAVNLIRDRILSIYLAAYQSWVWNRIIAVYFEQQGMAGDTNIQIAKERFPLPPPDEKLTALQSVLVDLPRLTARYEGPFKAAAEVALAAEDLEVRDFKARILRRAYLSKGERPVVFTPTDVETSTPTTDELNPDRYKIEVTFTLRPGQYATLVLKAAATLTGAPIRVR